MEEKYENSEGSYNYTIINRFGIYDELNIFSNLLFRINLLIVNFCRWDWVRFFRNQRNDLISFFSSSKIVVLKKGGESVTI